MKQPRLIPRSAGLFGICCLLAAAFVFGKVQGGFVPWFLFYAFLIVALYEVVVFLFALYGVRVERTISHERLHAGDTLEVQLQLRRPAFLPVAWMWVTDRMPETLHTSPRKSNQLLFPWFKKKMTLTYLCEGMPRGRHVWREVTVQTGDIFGMIQREKKWRIGHEVLVYPNVQEIPTWHTVNEHNIEAAYPLNRVSEDVTSVIGIRDYRHGDRLSRIHWKATAKGMGLKTKEFEYQASNDFMFFLDRRTVAYGRETHVLFERAVSLTASLIRYALRRRFSAGLVSYGKERYVLPATRHQGALIRFYEHLAEVRADGQLTFIQTLLRESVYLPHGSTIVCITPLIDAAFIEAVHQLRTRRFKVNVFWIRSSKELSNKERSWLYSLERLNLGVKVVPHERFEEIVRGREIAHA